MDPCQAFEIWPPGTSVDGRYQVLSILGRGGFGTAYLVRHIVLAETCVVKWLHSEHFQDEEHRRKFFEEARTIKPTDSQDFRLRENI